MLDDDGGLEGGGFVVGIWSTHDLLLLLRLRIRNIVGA